MTLFLKVVCLTLLYLNCMLDLLPNSSNKTLKLDPLELLVTAKAVLNRGETIVIINDIDLTVSTGGITGEDDPRKTTIYPKSAKALSQIESLGHKIGFISNRGGSQIGRMTKAAGIKDPSIIGTYGFETYKADHTSIIDDRFLPYSEDITKLLSTIELFVLDYTNQKELIIQGSETAIPFESDQIILERKGICEQFPKGIAALYNLNLINPNLRTKLVSATEEKYKEEIGLIMKTHHLLATALTRIWGINQDIQKPTQPGRFTLKFEPLLKQSKAYGMVNLLNNIRNNMQDNQRVGLIIYAGDSDQDAYAMKALKQIVKFHNEDYIAHTPIHAFNFWVKPDHIEKDAMREADIITEGVDGYAETLTELAKTVSLHTNTRFPFNFKQLFRI